MWLSEIQNMAEKEVDNKSETVLQNEDEDEEEQPR